MVSSEHMSQSRLALLLSCVLIFCFTATVEAKKLYRWTTEAGEIYYSDRVPPDQTKHQRVILDSQGIKVGSVEQAKSREQLVLEFQKEQALEKLRAEQRKLIAVQETKDRILLRTFSTEGDITLARDNKLESIDVAIQILRTIVVRTKKQLGSLQKRAANIERQGKKIAERLEEDISISRHKLSTHYSNIISREQEKELIFSQFDKDMGRFRDLKNIQIPINPSAQDKKRVASLLNSVFPCASIISCKSMWEIAGDYARKNSTTKLQLFSDTIILTYPPKKQDDISITISLIQQKNKSGYMIFMDMQCSTSPSGRDLCKSEEVTLIKRKFTELMLAASQRN